MFGELVDQRHLLFMLTWRDIHVRYKQTVMGFLWALIMPGLIVAAGILVKKTFASAQGASFDAAAVASLSVKALPWTFVVGSIRLATNSLSGNSRLLTRVYFLREVLPLSAVLANLFDFTVAAAVLGVVLAVSGIAPSMQLVWVPLILALLILITAAAGMLLACANLFFRDVRHLVDVALSLGIFFNPVLYDARRLGKWTPLVLANPIAPLLQALSDTIVLRAPPDLFWVGYAALWAVPGFVVASAIFGRAEPLFAERV